MSKTERRSRGRPEDPSKREALFDAARHLFLTKGIDVTLEEIAIEAKVSKATIYSKVTNKDALIEAVIRRESDLTVTDNQLQQSAHIPINEALYSFGLRYLRFINSQELLGWDKLIASAAARNPDLPPKFFAAGPGRGQAILTSMIAAATVRGELEVADAPLAADDLSGLWMGFISLEIKLGARAPLTGSEIEERVARGIKLFLKIYGPLNEAAALPQEH